MNQITRDGIEIEREARLETRGRRRAKAGRRMSCAPETGRGVRKPRSPVINSASLCEYDRLADAEAAFRKASHTGLSGENLRERRDFTIRGRFEKAPGLKTRCESERDADLPHEPMRRSSGVKSRSRSTPRPVISPTRMAPTPCECERKREDGLPECAPERVHSRRRAIFAGENHHHAKPRPTPAT